MICLNPRAAIPPRESFAYLCAAGNLTVLESTIKSSRPYHAGYDNVLLYAARVPYSC